MVKPQIKPQWNKSQANLTSHSMASALDSLWIQTQVWITSLNAIHIGGDYMHANCTLNDILRIKARIRATASTMLSTMGSAVDAYYLIPAMLPPTAGRRAAYLTEQIEVALERDHVIAVVRRNYVSQCWHGPRHLGGRHEAEDGEHGEPAIVDLNAQAPRFFLC